MQSTQHNTAAERMQHSMLSVLPAAQKWYMQNQSNKDSTAFTACSAVLQAAAAVVTVLWGGIQGGHVCLPGEYCQAGLLDFQSIVGHA